MKLAARFLTAMAIVSLAIVYVATRDQLPNAAAATGTIHALNVGTCYATDEDEFSKSDCMDGNGEFNVAGRKDVKETDELYATYAFDPKTSSDDPRGILLNSDLVKVSVKDQGRDERIGVLYAVGNSSDYADYDNYLKGDGAPDSDQDNYLAEVKSSVERFNLHENIYQEQMEAVTSGSNQRAAVPESFSLISDVAGFVVDDGGSGRRVISYSGERKLSLRGSAGNLAAAYDHPMAPIRDDEGHGMRLGNVLFFGFLQPTTNSPLETVPGANTGPFRDISSHLPPDEDYGCKVDLSADEPDKKCDRRAPWITVGASVPDGQAITVMYVYYETSQREELEGGKSRSDYEADGDDVAPGFSSDESEEDEPLSVSVSADGETTSRNLWLKESGRFTGNYVGYVRLTDADGVGKEAGQLDGDGEPIEDEVQNWGRFVRHGRSGTTTGEMIDKAAVLGVNAGPVNIRYRDTDDDDQSLAILIDTDQPSITIDAPGHEEAMRDASPNLQGEFEDVGSGLREDSFKLYADNKDDAAEDGDDGEPVFDLKVYTVDSTVRSRNPRGYVGDRNTHRINNAISYTGYGQTDDETFGIIRAAEVYLSETETYEGTESGDDIDRRKVVNAEDFDDGASDGEFDDSVRFDFASELPNETYNNNIDFQAVVLDIAGNLGFSDSDTDSPRFIHGYGEEQGDLKRDRHNVLGWYSRHILFLDLVDPIVQESESATGFFDEDEDGNWLRSTNGLMVVFDKPVSDETISNATFDVTLDNGDTAAVVDTAVEGKRVYLQIEETLAPDATPKVDLAAGEVIRDLAGNSTVPREFDEIELSDGILPTFTVTLSGGSGVEPPDYGEDKITKERMTVNVGSDEALQGAPQFVVLCENLQWYSATATIARDELTEAQKAEQLEANDIDKYVAERTGSMSTPEFNDAQPTEVDISADDENCDYDVVDNVNPNPDRFQEYTALRRGSNSWSYVWDKDVDGLLDGRLTVVVFGRDRGGFRDGTKSLFNYGTARAEFTLDTELKKPTAVDGSGGEVIPGPDEAVSEPRPFVLIDFSEKTPVTVTMFEVDNVNVRAQVEELDNNRFVYWPEPLDIGNYTVKVEANDAANNTADFQTKFTVRDRLPFALNLLAGWNTISFPANPQDRALHAVFTQPEIDQVIGWDATNADSPWRAATRVDGVWTTGEDYAVLNDIEARYGYWVHSLDFVTQSVKLVGKGDRVGGELFAQTTDIRTMPGGWNFIGVVDVDGDQTEDNAGQTLLNSKKAPISAEQYLGEDYRNAYTWDNVENKWQRLGRDRPVTIGTGIWVYYDRVGRAREGDIAP